MLALYRHCTMYNFVRNCFGQTNVLITAMLFHWTVAKTTEKNSFLFTNIYLRFRFRYEVSIRRRDRNK